MTSQVSSPAEQAARAEQPSGAAAPSPVDSGPPSVKEVRRLDRVIIRFAGDSGDGMQLTGDRFTS
ncbi:hypothetical protein, partial [Streptomyces sp. NPDC008001]|uniref:hypothetical protein n=1 Tax=Streptomyces sp. NPDC008001 TaxID=3364804 RepID=UPI0036ECF2F2